jgi:hypothetical protein
LGSLWLLCHVLTRHRKFTDSSGRCFGSIPNGLTLPIGSIRKTLTPEIVDILNAAIAEEYTAHYFYRNATNWCAGIGYLKAAAFFAQEAENELEHAKGLQKYLVDWNVMPLLPSIKPNITFTDLINPSEEGLRRTIADSLAAVKPSMDLLNLITSGASIQRTSANSPMDMLFME